MQIVYAIRLITLISFIPLIIGCGDTKMRARISSLDDKTLLEIQDNYPPDSKEGILIARELKHRGAQKPAAKKEPVAPAIHKDPPQRHIKPLEPSESAKPAVEFRTGGYYKSKDKHRIFSYYPVKALDGDISEDIWKQIKQIGLKEMHTAGKTTRVFFYTDETSALKARLSQHASHEAALQGAYYAKPFASVEIMFDGGKWLTKYPETDQQEVIEL